MARLNLINWTVCSSHDVCINWNDPQVSCLTLWTMLEYELVDANRVYQGIQKVRVEPATRSVVATWLHYIMLNNFSPSGSVTYYAEPFFSYQECKNAWSAGSKVAVSDASISQFCKFKGNSPSPSSINSSLLSSAKGCRSAWLYVALTFVTINRDHTLDIVYSRTPVLLGYVCLWL